MQIEIADTDFLRLQSLAVPLIDTPATIVTRILDFYEANNGIEARSDKITEDETVLSFEIPPLTHTKLLMANFDKSEPDRLTWDGLLRLALTKGFRKAESAKELKAASGANIVDRVKNDQGYKYLDDLKLSYQGVSAEDAVRIIRRLSEYLGVTCEFKFEWRDKPGAYRPGQVAFGHIGSGLLKVSWK